MKILGCKIKEKETAETKALQRLEKRIKAEKEKDPFYELGLENISPIEKKENIDVLKGIGVRNVIRY